MSETPDPLPRPLGPYELTDRLGVGSQGSVYLGRLRRFAGLGPQVAIKTLGPGTAPIDPRRLGALIREGRIGLRVTHPNLVRVLDVGEVDGRPYVAMEFVDGCSLTALRRVCGPLSPEAWLEVAQQAALGLAALHDVGVVGDIGTPLLHLDLKPGNLLVDRTGCVKLTDYGISRFTVASDAAQIEGTPGYMSAEQFQGETPDQRSDLFGLGVTLHRLLSRTRLLPAKPLFEARMAVLELDETLEDPATWVELDAAIPGVSAVLRRCLWRDRDARFRDVHALWAALSSLKTGPHSGPSLAELVERTAGGPRVVSVPRPPAHPFVGREHALTVVRRRSATEPLTWVVGGDGMGKSALVWHAVPGATWVSAADVWDERELTRRTLRALHLAEDADLDQVLPLVPPRRVVVDGIDASAEALVGALARWSAAAPEMRWIGTSRQPPADPAQAEAVVELGPLPPRDAATLVRRYAPEVSKRQAEALARRLMGRPASVELVGIALSRGTPVEEAVQSADRVQGAPGTVDRMWDRLADDERHALAQLLAFRGPFTPADAEALVEGRDGALQEIIEELQHHRIIEPLGARLRVAPHLRAGLERRRAEVLDGRAQRALELRHAMHLSRLGDPAWLAGLAGPRSAHRLRTLTSRHDDLVAAHACAAATGAATTAARCLKALYAIAEAGRGDAPGLDAVDAILGAPSVAAEERVRVALWFVEGHSRGGAVKVEELARQALAEAEVLGHAPLACRAEVTLGGLLVHLGQQGDAALHLARGLDCARALGDRLQESRALLADARRLGRLGRDAEALDRLGAALEVAEDREDAAQAAWVRAQRGALLVRRGQREDAVEELQEAGEQLEVLGRWSSASVAWQNVAAAVQGDDVPSAMSALKRAHRLSVQAGDNAQAHDVHCSVAALLVEIGRGDEARQIYADVALAAARDQALDTQRKVVLHQIGQAVTQRDWGALADHCARARQLHVADGNAWFRATLAYSEARLALMTNDAELERAALATLRAEVDGERLRHLLWMRHDIVGRQAAKDGQRDAAVVHLREALACARDLDTGAAIDILDALVQALLAQGDADEARALVAEARRWSAGTLHPAGPARALLDRAARRIQASRG